nr:penicillin-binding transpeptidase domain-containing protein [uncultured Draconibacterium sp.]
MKNLILIFGFCIYLPGFTQQRNNNTNQKSDVYTKLSLDSIFQENPGTFVLYDLQNNSYKLYNQERAKQKFAVHSTSKILWSIVGLEENLISNETDIVKWDSVIYPPKPGWPDVFNQDQTIVSALKFSVNWYYFELLKLMTPEMIEKYLNALDYQKGYHVEKVHYFELTFTLKKSAFEQIDFLKSLYFNEFNLSAKTLDIVKKGMLYSSQSGCTVYTKTGTGPIANDNGIGWLIGWIEKGEKIYFFALNVEDKDEIKAGKLRYDYGFRVLQALNLCIKSH